MEVPSDIMEDGFCGVIVKQKLGGEEVDPESKLFWKRNYIK